MFTKGWNMNLNSGSWDQMENSKWKNIDQWWGIFQEQNGKKKMYLTAIGKQVNFKEC